jgi:plasmid stability protein
VASFALAAKLENQAQRGIVPLAARHAAHGHPQLEQMREILRAETEMRSAEVSKTASAAVDGHVELLDLSYRDLVACE